MTELERERVTALAHWAYEALEPRVLHVAMRALEGHGVALGAALDEWRKHQQEIQMHQQELDERERDAKPREKLH